MIRSEVEYADTQGLMRYGYGRMTTCCYFLVRVKDPAAARSWLRGAPITNAVETDPPPSTAMQVAFTATGLESIGVTPSVIAGFSHEFVSGMTNESRSRRLGDVGNNAPSQWTWGGSTRVPHLLVMFFGEPGRLDALVASATGSGWNDAFDVLLCLDTGTLDGREPFGFVDGISQPQVDWTQQLDGKGSHVHYSNVVALGEFVLGYRNEYGKYTERPLIDADPASADLLPAEDAPGKRDVGRNGTYLVMRQLRQDVRGFWQFIRQQVGGDFAAADKLAAAMVGRTRMGDPLAPIQDEPIPGIGPQANQVRQNQFTFDADPAGVACAFGAHIRRQNPRNPDIPGSPTGLALLVATLGFGRKGFWDDLTSSVRFHRILRRGRTYGPALAPEEAIEPAPPDDVERGLHFVCLNANIARQFEFLQHAWTMSTKFSGLTGESDPLVGNRAAVPGCPITANFTLQADGGLRRQVLGLPQFVTVCGGAYFFLPGLRALRYFARARIA